MKQKRIRILLLKICKRCDDLSILLLRLISTRRQIGKIISQDRSNSFGSLPRRQSFGKLTIEIMSVSQDQPRERIGFIPLMPWSIGLHSGIGLRRAVLQ